jgi:uncharacterized membrane protein
MITVSSELQAGLEDNALVPRDFITFTVKDRSDNSAVVENYWSGSTERTVDIINPFNGFTESRTFQAAGGLIGIGPIPRVGNLTVGTVTVQLSQISDDIDRLIRQYEPKYGQVEMYRGWLNPETKLVIGEARCRFVGFIDDVEIITPEEGGEGVVEVTCKTLTQELTRASAATRSDAYQKLRSPTDTFRKYSATIGNREFRWGQR